MEFKKIVKEKRTELSLTQEQLAEVLLVSSKTISNWETGKTMPDIDSLIRFSRLFNVSLDNLLLEGSELVENVKEQAELTATRHLLATASVTNFVFLFIVIATHFFPATFGELSLPIVFALVVGEVANLFAILHFSTKIVGLTHQPAKQLEKRVVLGAVIGILIMLIVVVITALSSKHLFY